MLAVFWDTFFSGLVLGGIYALVAVGLTLQYGVARVMNLAYGEFTIAGAFLAYVAFIQYQVSPLITLFFALPLGFALNWAVYRLLMVPLARRTPTGASMEVTTILATFGLLFVVQGALLIAFGGSYYSYSFLAVPVDVLGSIVPANRLVAAGVALAASTGLYLFLLASRYGTAIRAVSVNAGAAPLVGIDPARYAALAFAVGGALVAASGVLLSMFLTFNTSMGIVFTMKALIIVIMGGVGNVLGAFFAGLLLGVVESVVSAYVDPGLTLAANFMIFLSVLLLRPTGLFGRRA